MNKELTFADKILIKKVLTLALKNANFGQLQEISRAANQTPTSLGRELAGVVIGIMANRDYGDPPPLKWSVPEHGLDPEEDGGGE